MTTIPNPLDSQRDELITLRIQRDFLQDQLNEIATAIYVRATIPCEDDVVGGVNELLDSWEQLYSEKVEGLRIQLATPSEMRKRFMDDEYRRRFGSDNGE